MEFRQHKRDYYVHKLGYAQVNEDTLRDQAEGYVRWETCIPRTLVYLFCFFPHETYFSCWVSSWAGYKAVFVDPDSMGSLDPYQDPGEQKLPTKIEES